MIYPVRAQENPYRGDPPRPWLDVRFVARDGSIREHALVVDTGSPAHVIIGPDLLAAVTWRGGVPMGSNFGDMESGDVHVIVSEIEDEHEVLAYSSLRVLDAVRRDDPGFGGLIGLPLLRLMEYGGNAHRFWVRMPLRKT